MSEEEAGISYYLAPPLSFKASLRCSLDLIGHPSAPFPLLLSLVGGLWTGGEVMGKEACCLALNLVTSLPHLRDSIRGRLY